MIRIPLADWKRLVDEQQALCGLHVDNVFQIDPRCFLLRLTPGKLSLLIDATAGRPRAVVTDDPPSVPDRPPMFGSILRRALRGSTIGTIRLIGDDRLYSATFGDRELVLEAMPNRPNLLLLDSKGVVERVLDGEAAKRRKTPIGSPYTAPTAPTLRPEDSVLPKDIDNAPFAANHELDRQARGGVSEEKEEKTARKRERLLQRLDKSIASAQRDLGELPDPTEVRKQGQLLLENFPALTAGMKKFRGVALDPKLQPNENIDRVFKRARKADRARPYIEARLKELGEIRTRVESGELVPDNQVPGKRPQREAPRRPYRVFLAENGDRILVGKGGRDNDETTMRVASANDIFLHVRGSPGAHVIVPVPKGDQVNEETLVDAGHLALHYSKMKKADRADITWTPRRNVKKPKGAKPGLVSVTQEKVLHLRREPERLTRLLMSQVEPK